MSFLEEYAPSEAEKKSYTKFARNVRAKMVEYLQSKNQKIETTDHSYVPLSVVSLIRWYVRCWLNHYVMLCSCPHRYADVKLFSMANKKFASQEVVVEKVQTV